MKSISTRITVNQDNEYTLRDSDMPPLNHKAVLINGTMPVFEITHNEIGISILSFTENQVNIWGSIQAKQLNINAKGNVCLDVKTQCEDISLAAKSLTTFQPINCRRLTCTVKETLSLQEGKITVHDRLTLQAKQVEQLAALEVLGKTFIKVDTFDSKQTLFIHDVESIEVNKWRLKGAYDYVIDALPTAKVTINDCRSEEISTVHLRNARFNFRDFNCSGKLRLNNAKINCVNTFLVGQKSNLIAINSTLKCQQVRLNLEWIDSEKFSIEAVLATINTDKGLFKNQSITVHTLSLAGNPHFLNSRLNYSVLVIHGTILIDSSECESLAKEEHTHSIWGTLTIKNSTYTSDAHVNVKHDGRLCIEGTKSVVTSQHMLVQGEMALDHAQLTTKEFIYDGASFFASHSKLFVENGFFRTLGLIPNQQGVGIIDCEWNGNALSLQGKIKLIRTVVKAEQDLTILKYTLIEGSDNTLTVLKGMRVDGIVDLNKTSLSVDHDLQINEQFVLNGGADYHLKVGGALDLASGVTSQINTNITVEKNTTLQGTFIQSDPCSITINKTLKITPLATLGLHNSRVTLNEFKHFGHLISGDSHLHIKEQFDADQYSRISGLRLHATAKNMTMHADVTMKQLKLEAEEAALKGTYTLHELELCFNYSGVNHAFITTKSFKVISPFWQNENLITANQSYQSYTLFENMGAVVIRGAKERHYLIALGTSQPLYIPDPYQILAFTHQPKQMLSTLLSLIRNHHEYFMPSAINNAVSLGMAAYYLHDSLMKDSSAISLSYKKYCETSYQKDQSKAWNLSNYIATIPRHEYLSFLWELKRFCEQGHDLYKISSSKETRDNFDNLKNSLTAQEVTQMPSNLRKFASEKIRDVYDNLPNRPTAQSLSNLPKFAFENKENLQKKASESWNYLKTQSALGFKKLSTEFYKLPPGTIPNILKDDLKFFLPRHYEEGLAECSIGFNVLGNYESKHVFSLHNRNDYSLYRNSYAYYGVNNGLYVAAFDLSLAGGLMYNQRGIYSFYHTRIQYDTIYHKDATLHLRGGVAKGSNAFFENTTIDAKKMHLDYEDSITLDKETTATYEDVGYSTKILTDDSRVDFKKIFSINASKRMDYSGHYEGEQISIVSEGELNLNTPLDVDKATIKAKVLNNHSKLLTNHMNYKFETLNNTKDGLIVCNKEAYQNYLNTRESLAAQTEIEGPKGSNENESERPVSLPQDSATPNENQQKPDSVQPTEKTNPAQTETLATEILNNQGGIFTADAAVSVETKLHNSNEITQVGNSSLTSNKDFENTAKVTTPSLETNGERYKNTGIVLANNLRGTVDTFLNTNQTCANTTELKTQLFQNDGSLLSQEKTNITSVKTILSPGSVTEVHNGAFNGQFFDGGQNISNEEKDELVNRAAEQMQGEGLDKDYSVGKVYVPEGQYTQNPAVLIAENMKFSMNEASYLFPNLLFQSLGTTGLKTTNLFDFSKTYIEKEHRVDATNLGVHFGTVSGKKLIYDAPSSDFFGASNLNEAELRGDINDFVLNRNYQVDTSLTGNFQGYQPRMTQDYLWRNINTRLSNIDSINGNLQSDHLLSLSGKAFDLYHSITAPRFEVHAESRINVNGNQQAAEYMLFKTSGAFTHNSGTLNAPKVWVQGDSLLFRPESKVDAGEFVQKANNGNIIVESPLRATTHMNITQENKGAQINIISTPLYPVTCPTKTPPKNPIKGTIYVYKDIHAKTKEEREKIYIVVYSPQGGVAKFNYFDVFPTLDRATCITEFDNQRKKNGFSPDNSFSNKIAEFVHQKLGLSHGSLQGGDGTNYQGVGLELDVGHLNLKGNASLNANGSIQGTVTSFTANTPEIVNSSKEKWKSGKSLLQKALGMDRGSLINTQTVHGASIRSENGSIRIHSKGDFNAQSLTVSTPQNKVLTAEGSITLTTTVTEYSKVRAQLGNPGKRSSSRKQNSTPTELSGGGVTLIKGQGPVNLLGISVHGPEENKGDLIVHSDKSITLDNTKVESEKKERYTITKVFVNGFEVSDAVMSLINSHHLPKDEWTKKWQELKNKEPMVGLIEDCLDANNVYESLLASWNVGIGGVEALQNLAKGVNGTLLTEMRNRYGMNSLEVTTTTTEHFRHVRRESLANNEGVNQTNISLYSPTLYLNGGIFWHADNQVYLRVDDIIAQATKCSFRDVTIDYSMTLGFGALGFVFGLGYKRHSEHGSQYFAPTFSSKGALIFDLVKNITGTVGFNANQLSGSIDNLKLVTIPDVLKVSDAEFSFTTSGNFSAYYGKGIFKTIGAGAAYLYANDATGLTIGNALLYGSKLIIPNANIDHVEGHNLKGLGSNYKGFGISGNAKEMQEYFAENNQNEEKPLFTKASASINLQDSRSKQQAVVFGANIGSVSGTVHTKNIDGLIQKNDFSVNSSLTIPLTTRPCIEEAKTNFLKASDKILNVLSLTKTSSNDEREQARHALALELELQVQLFLASTHPGATLKEETSDPNSSATTDTRNNQDSYQDDDDFFNDYFPIRNEGSSSSQEPNSSSTDLNKKPLPIDLIKKGISDSSLGLILKDKNSAPSIDMNSLDTLDRLTYGVATVGGDIPVIIATGKAIQIIANLCKANPIGWAVTIVGGAVIFAIPAFIRETKYAYEEYKKENPNSDFSLKEFAQLYGKDIFKETGKEAITGAIVCTAGKGAATAFKGSKLAQNLTKVNANLIQPHHSVAEVIVEKTAETLAMGSVPSLLEGELPPGQTMLDTVLLLGVMNATQGGIHTLGNKLANNHSQAKYFPPENQNRTLNSISDLGLEAKLANLSQSTTEKPGLGSRSIVDLKDFNLKTFGLETTDFPVLFENISPNDIYHPLPPFKKLTVDDVRKNVFGTNIGKQDLYRYVILEDGKLIISEPFSNLIPLKPAELQQYTSQESPNINKIIVKNERLLPLNEMEYLVYDPGAKIPKGKVIALAHPEISGLNKVIAAGDVYAKDGKIISIDNHTGHFVAQAKSLAHISEQQTLVEHVFSEFGFNEARGCFNVELARKLMANPNATAPITLKRGQDVRQIANQHFKNMQGLTFFSPDASNIKPITGLVEKIFSPHLNEEETSISNSH